jgi:hypothetical protein
MEVHKGKIYSNYKVNELLDCCDIFLDNEDKSSLTITQEYSDIHNEDAEDIEGESYYYGLLEPLVGYVVSRKTEGEHDHDSSMVRYEFTFTSPEGEETKIITIMNLMIGFNIDKDITFK